MALIDVRPQRDPARVAVVGEAGGVGVIHMRDEAGHNAFSPPFVAALLAAIDEVSADRALRAVVLRGTVDVFASGATAEVLAELAAGAFPPTELTLGRRLMDVPVPVVAACEGHAVGGGLALAMSADLCVLAAESRYGANFLSLGITPGMGTTALLEHALGPMAAHELLYTGGYRKGAELARAGLGAVEPRARVFERAMQTALAIAEKPPRAVRLLKRTLTLPRRRAFEEALTLESLMHESTLGGADPAAMPGGPR